MELNEMKTQLEEWLGIGSHFKYKMEDCSTIDEENTRVRVYLFTKTNKYSISASLPDLNRKEDDKGYLGCTTSCRTPRAGEVWTRGSDLPDGDFSFETWIKIISSIVNYELVKIHKPVMSIADEVSIEASDN
jgi:hypothetical protein